MSQSIEKIFAIVPDHDEDIEKCVLGAMLCEPLAVEVAREMLTPDAFYKERTRWLYIKFQAIFQIQHALDEKIVLAELLSQAKDKDEFRDYIAKLIMGVPTAANIEGYCGEVLRLYAKRRRLDFALRILNEYVIDKKENREHVRRERANPTAHAGTGA